MEDIINVWKEGKNSVSSYTSPERIMRTAIVKKKNVVLAHLTTLGVLTITLVILVAFLATQTDYTTSLSISGLWLMVVALALRTWIEVISILRSRSIKLSGTANEASRDALSFYSFRKKVHGPVSIGIAGLYVLGFYGITPEMSQYFALKWLIFIHALFLIVAILLVLIAVKGIKKEHQSLTYLINVRNEIIDSI